MISIHGSLLIFPVLDTLHNILPCFKTAVYAGNEMIKEHVYNKELITIKSLKVP
jgi:hypothetical protein